MDDENGDTRSVSMLFAMDDSDNVTSRPRIFDDIVHIVWTVDFAMLLLALVVGIVWFTYLTYYNSRVIGFILTKVSNCFHSTGTISIGSLSISLLSGKLMVGNIIYFHRDFTLRIQYACVIFRFWRPYKQRRVGTDDFSQVEPRLMIEISGLEVHMYNRVRRYQELDKLFNLGIFEFESAIVAAKDGIKAQLLHKEHETASLNELAAPVPLTAAEIKKRLDWWSCWFSLIPRIDFSVLVARLSFGNRLLPSTLVISFENGKARCSVKPPTNVLDDFQHVINGSCENFKVSLIKSMDYAGKYEQPPRTMGDGFVVLQTSQLEFAYNQEEAGVVPDGMTDFLANSSPPPSWGGDLRLGKGTVISYGPWADSQRDQLHKFFFPPDLQCGPIFRTPPPGARRAFTKFDLKIKCLHDATIDIWFVPNELPQAIHINFCQGSYCDLSVPMVFEETGYVSTIVGQLTNVESSTSLPYRSLLSSETFEFNANLHYPRQWNQEIMWEFFFRGSKSALWLLYEHKVFLQQLLSEWSSESPPDICGFTPYTYIFECGFEDVEVVLALNEHNWIDTSSNQEENRRGAIGGRSLHVSFTLPFMEFMPDATELKVDIAGEDLSLKVFFPEQDVLSQPLAALHSGASKYWHDIDRSPTTSRWKGPATSENGWIECAYSPKGTVSLAYYLHHLPIRPFWQLAASDASPKASTSAISLDPDRIRIQLEIGPCYIQLSAAMVIFILSLKDNYFGEMQSFTEVEKYGDEVAERKCGSIDSEDFDIRKYRPLNVAVSLTLREIEAQCLIFAVSTDAQCPLAKTEKLVFEMDKQYAETKMQLCISPVTARFGHSHKMDSKMDSAQEGRLLLTGFQLRGHALFSAEGLPLDSVTIEYGWLLEILLGDLIGRLTVENVAQVIGFLKPFLQILSNKEERLPLPKYADVCQHMWPRSICPSSAKSGGVQCDTEHALKYRMIRASVDRIQVCLFEWNSALELNVTPLRLAHCTEHTATGKMGADIFVPRVSLRQFVKKTKLEENEEFASGRDSKGSIATNEVNSADEREHWMECGKVTTEMVMLHLTAPQDDSSYYEKRREFLLMHDQRSRRLQFLHRSPRHDYACGCTGGCVFFDDNRNGVYFTESSARQSPSNVNTLAIPKLESDRSNPGYGQSILRHQEMIMEHVCELQLQQSAFEDASEDTVCSEVSKCVESPDHYHQASDEVASQMGTPYTEKAKAISEEQESSTSTSRSSSYVSTVSRTEHPAINLYYQVNRPIVSSLLLSSYGRYLDSYVCQTYRARTSPSQDNTVTGAVQSKDHCELEFSIFSMKRRGLNSVAFIPVSDGNTKVDKKEELFKLHFVRERIERRAGLVQQENKEATITDLQKVDVRFLLGDHCEIFVSPLGVEMLERQVRRWTEQGDAQHPISLVMDAFDQCAGRKHSQAIVWTNENGFDSTTNPIHISLTAPRIDFTIFQCGIVEKIVPFSHLAQATSLMPTSVFVSCVERLSVQALIEKIAPLEERAARTSYTVDAGFDNMFFHVTQIIEKGAATIGISKNASNIGRWVSYDSLRWNATSPCVVIEGRVTFVDVFVRKIEENKRDMHKLSVCSSAAAVGGQKTPDIAPSSPHSTDQFKNRLDGLLADISVHFGLLQPLEHSGDNWPLYDLFAPSASAWLHVVHRLSSALAAAGEAWDYARRSPFCFLLTEALNSDQSFSVRKSKFEKLKHRRKRLHECPSCQTLLALMRFCASPEFADFEQRWRMPSELKQPNILKSAVVALLSHWREALCANSFVRLNAAAAKNFATSPSYEEKKIDTDVVIDIDGDAPKTDRITTDAIGNAPSSLHLQIPKLRIESLQYLAAKFEHFEELEAAASTPGSNVQGKLDKPSALSLASKRGPGSSSKLTASPALTTGAGMDLYEWMKREQAGYSKTKKRKQSRYRKSTDDDGEEINPMDVPLYVYFDFLFQHLKLKRSVRKSTLFAVMGHDLVVDLRLHRIFATVNEPKYLGLAGSTLKRVTHTERPLIGIQELTLRADAKYCEEPAKETSLTPLPGSKEDASPPKQAVQSIDYHVNLVTCDITVGFPSVTFINQVVYVIRSMKETFDELQGRRKTCEQPEMETQPNAPGTCGPRLSTASDTTQLTASVGQSPPAQVDSGGETSPEVVIDLDGAPPASKRRSSSSHTNSSRKRQKGGDVDRNTFSHRAQKQHWTKRMLTILRDFQRAKRSSMRRLSPTTPSPTHDAVLVTTVLGAIDCTKVEINAMFTELFAYATFKSVQLGHKSTESWTAVGQSQLRSSDKSVRGAVKQINLTLSEVQSLHAVPVNVLTFSVAESNAIFRRYFQQLVSATGDAWRNSLGVDIGPIHVDIPLHAGSLHGLVVRGTKNISDRLPFLMTPSVVEEVVHIKKESSIGHYSRKFNKFENVAVINFRIAVKEVQVDAALLPSLKASYKIIDVAAFGETGGEAKFQIKVPSHEVAFDVKGIMPESPSLAVAPKILVAFPKIDAKGAYVHRQQRELDSERVRDPDMLFKEGGYLQIDVDVGAVQHTLTTDLLTQLLFIQEAFTSEIGEIIQKIRSEKKPATIWSATSAGKKQLLYSIEVTVNAVQIMATTPTATAVRLDAENVRLHISNRLMRKTKGDALERVFGVTELTISLSLGQLVRVASHQEVEPEFQQFGYFRTAVSMRNVASSSDAGQDGMEFAAATDSNGNTYLVTLYSPVIFAQPTAVDKALLLWLNYKNAYEFWNEQRSQIKPKSRRAAFDSRRDSTGRSVFEQLGSPPLLATKSLFLQVSVENGLYICVPLYGVRHGSLLRSADVTNSALVISLGDTAIAVCSHGALVCQGRFKEFGLRFVEDFDGNADNWNPASLTVDDPSASTEVNACFVPDGTYEICSKTITPVDDKSPAHWILNISWKMKGFDMNLNTRIWKLTSLLVSTLTSLATAETEETAVASSRRASPSPEERPDSVAGEFPSGAEEAPAATAADELSFITAMVPGSSRKRILQKTYHEVVAKIRALEQQEADELLIEKERKKLLRLEALLFSDSRRDVVTKLRRQAQKATTTLIDQWGLNVKSTGDGEGEKADQKRHQLDTSPPQQHNSRRFSELPSREYQRQQTRAGSVDSAGPGFAQLRRVSESESPSPPQQALSFDFGDDADYFNELSAIHSRSQSPDDEESGVHQPVPSVVLEGPGGLDRSGASGQPTSTRPQPPAVDLYLDLSIFVENGRCNFRSAVSKILEPQETCAAAVMKKHEKDPRGRRQKSSSTRLDRMRQSSQQTIPIYTTTVFLPGLNVKGSYASSSGGLNTRGSVSDAEPVTRTSMGAGDENAVGTNLLGGKYGQLILWMSLEEMPEETVISPHILDFLEQLLEPMPNSTVSTLDPTSVAESKSPAADAAPKPAEEATAAAAVHGGESTDTETIGLDASTLATVASFPLDIVFHLNVQSSQIRFTSQPLAQIECILRLPTLQLVATSRKCSELVISGGQPSEPGIKRTLSASGLVVRLPEDDLSGGICVTVLLTGFSVSVFHMYSAGARAGMMSSAALEKRDALSIHMNEVALSLSRSRITTGSGDTLLSTSTASGPSSSSLRPSKNCVKVSLVINMGKAQFKYDMRRLHEILQFPKAWYRRAIFRRLFLGDETVSNSHVRYSPSLASSASGSTNKPVKDWQHDAPSRKVSKVSRSVDSSTSSDDDVNEDENEDDFDDTLLGLGLFRRRTQRGQQAATNRASWGAMVLFAINFEELSIDAMMGQVMGETKWVFAGADCQGQFALSSDKTKSVYVAFHLARSELVAKQGQVSGLMNLSAFEASAFVKKSGRRTPESQVNARLQCLDLRIDWMSSPTFMGRLTDLDCSLKDDWRIEQERNGDGADPCVDQVAVLILGTVSWESFRMLLTQTTVTDIIRICYKVNEFIDQSLQSGRMALFFHTMPMSRDRTRPQASASNAENIEAANESAESIEQPQQTATKRYHRHWQKALAIVTSLQLEAADFFPIPRNATILGGIIEFSGDDLALACFGSNLHSKEWLVFHLREPSIEFSTEAKDICLENGELAQLIDQDLCFRLGHRQLKRISTHMGTVLCVSGAYAATHTSSIDEWLAHAFTSVLNRVYRIQSPVAFRHQYKEAFYIPPLAVHVKTKQIQSADHLGQAPLSQPTVQSSVIADFEDHLKINVQEVLYLRRFIKAYISRTEPTGGPGDRSRRVADPTQELQKDAREYVTTTWHVEPTIRLMSLESMETTDYLWQILGIYQYAVTVSKWLQRGFLDPLDSVVASLMEQILTAEKKSKQQ